MTFFLKCFYRQENKTYRKIRIKRKTRKSYNLKSFMTDTFQEEKNPNYKLLMKRVVKTPMMKKINNK